MNIEYYAKTFKKISVCVTTLFCHEFCHETGSIRIEIIYIVTLKIKQFILNFFKKVFRGINFKKVIETSLTLL